MGKDFIIGIDTGGTYTDAVVIERGAQRIRATAKSITTKGDLSVGVGLAMAEAVSKLANRAHPSEFALVSISTTLATNAVVEGHGGSVAVVLIGFDDRMVARTGIVDAFPDMPLLRVAGGHDHNGEEVASLDLPALQAAFASLPGKVDSIAIASTFAVRNNMHELKAGELASSMLGLPVTLSSELSSALDAPRRALTAVLNARLIGHISRLIAAVKQAMRRLGIECPLMIMKGDGALASAESVIMRPIETILSGPAASLIGAKWLSGLDNFVMSDMGGTTTDVGILENGRPLVAAQGADVGGWRTMVTTIDVKTIGLGGDSEITVGNNGKIEVGPQRAVPISLLAQRVPEVMAMLEADVADTEGASLHGRFVVLPFGKVAGQPLHGLGPREAEILSQVSEFPVPLRKLAVSSAAQRAISSLRRKGLVQVSGFTPSDAAHVLGLQDNWLKEAAVQAARLLHRFRTMKLPDPDALHALCREIWAATVAGSARVILHATLGGIADSKSLIDAVCEGRAHVGRTHVRLTPKLPIVAVGGPARVYYDEVARRLGTQVVFAPYCDVANAAGAASALVSNRVIVTVNGDGSGLFRVHAAGHAEVFGSGVQALRHAQALAEKLATQQAVANGAMDPRVEVSIVKNVMPEAQDDESLLAATITAEAIGRPA